MRSGNIIGSPSWHSGTFDVSEVGWHIPAGFRKLKKNVLRVKSGSSVIFSCYLLLLEEFTTTRASMHLNGVSPVAVVFNDRRRSLSYLDTRSRCYKDRYSFTSKYARALCMMSPIPARVALRKIFILCIMSDHESVICLCSSMNRYAWCHDYARYSRSRASRKNIQCSGFPRAGPRTGGKCGAKDLLFIVIGHS